MVKEGRRVYVIYVDVLFVINFVMDCLILMLVGRIFGHTATWLRIVTASALGALWVCVISVYTRFPGVIETILSYAVISSLMLVIAFKVKKPLSLFKHQIALYLCTFLWGGAFNAIYYHTNLGYYLNKIIRGDYNKPSKVKDILFIGVLAFIIAAVLLYIIVKMRKKSTEIFDMDVEMDQKTITVKGFKDTGNRLTEPMSKKCVSLEAFKPLLTEDMEKFIQEFLNTETINYDYLTEEFTWRVKLIPYRSVGKDQGYMLGFIVDRLLIHGEGSKEIEKPILGIIGQKIKGLGTCQMIIHPEMIEDGLGAGIISE